MVRYSCNGFNRNGEYSTDFFFYSVCIATLFFFYSFRLCKNFILGLCQDFIARFELVKSYILKL